MVKNPEIVTVEAIRLIYHKNGYDSRYPPVKLSGEIDAAKRFILDYCANRRDLRVA